MLSILSLVSGAYLGYSIYNIKKKITEKDDELNVKIMFLHAASFILFILSTLF